MKDILYFNTLEDIKIVDMLRTTSKEKELPNQIILTIQSAGAGVVTPIFSKDAQGTTIFASIDEIGTKFILDGKEVTSDNFQLIEEKFNFFGLQFKDSKEHILKVSLTDFTIKPDTFIANVYLKKVIIGTSITQISEDAFCGCPGLTSVTIPNSVTEIGMNAFSGCTGLTSITIPDSVTEIGNSAFSGCTGLTSITIPDSVTMIGSSAFAGCTGLTSINIPDSVKEIGKNAFEGCTGLTSIVIPDSVTWIDGYAFSGCSGLTSVTIPNSVTWIDGYAFSGCSGLASITSLATVAPTISNNTFFNIKSLGTIYVPAGSDYSTWMSTSNYYLGKYNWIEVEDTQSSTPFPLDPQPQFPPDDAV